MGQFGVFGSDSPRGIRWRTDATVWFVDNMHPGCSDDNMGTDPEAPLATLTAAIINRVGDARYGNPYDVVVVGGTGYTESIVVAPTFPMYVTILGAGGTDHRPTWAAATAAGTALTIRQEGWTVESFTFETGAAGTGVRLEEVTIGSYTAYKTTIRNCRFDGLYGGLYGIDFYGAPHRVTIENCMFLEYHRGAGTAYAIIVSNTAVGPGSPYQGSVVGCRFQNCDSYVGGLGGIVGFNLTLFQGNTFFTSHAALLPITNVYLDLRGGSRGYNIVTGNYFGGVYTNAGGYFAHPATPNTCWVGNLTEPTPGTVADNGLTVQTPA